MHILRPIVKNIKESSYYSIMADETTDIINKEQFVICIRWVDNDLNANKDFIGLHELSVTNADVFCKKGVLKNLAKFTGKHLHQSLFFNKAAGLSLQLY